MMGMRTGVPLPFFLHRVTGELHPDTLALVDRAAALVEEGGVEAWSRLDPAEWLGAEAADYAKSHDILDVWFDSGSTFFHVLRGSHEGGRHESGPEADALYKATGARVPDIGMWDLRRMSERATPPWDSDALSRAVGVNPDDFDRHTALGDARWAKAMYEAVMGA